MPFIMEYHMSNINKVIFVHGAWADEHCWTKARAIVDAAGIATAVVHLPLTTLDADAAAVTAALEQESGPVLLVGHSYGGAVITQAGAAANVAGLVFINAFVPDVDESALGLTALVPPSRMSSELRPDEQGFLSLTRDGVFEGFAQDCSTEEKEALYAQQRPTSGAALSTPVSTAAWRSKPSWYLLATEDQAIPLPLQQIFVTKLGAATMTASTPAGHCSMVSQPRAVADLVLQAAATVGA
jgi:pimeloyl-ACP methyl ester carboxylesterase